ncbi:MAG TPA: methylmalonyl Co-A mutase-associated GTPase MeaB [Xanthobacteraceae bacterium]|nr:methylmalonyl Co-A mutase-associated GTPase MeaB [Xanthobacteraceae bacterium]
MTRRLSSLELLERVKVGDQAAIARLISRAEGGKPEDRAALAGVYKIAGRAHIIGVTGVPGSGKSTLVARLAASLRASGRRIGVVAIDPSSPYSGGSILGDRVRMNAVATDPGIYIRSMASHGATGGMARATLDAVDILDVAGFGTVIVETVGVGQDEVEIARASHTTVVVSAPGLGDEIQAIKAGILEIADIHVVSKCDRGDANRTLVDLKQMLMLGLSHEKPEWTAPVIGTSSISGAGFDELVAAIEKHRLIAFETERGRKRRLAIADFRLRKTAEDLLLARFNASLGQLSRSLPTRLAERQTDPYSLASELLRTLPLREDSPGAHHERDARPKIA